MMKRYCVFAVTSLFLVALTGRALAARVEHIEEGFLLPAKEASVSIQNVTGDILIYGWDEEKVRMVVTKSARALWEKKAQDFLKSIEIEISSKEDQLKISTRYPAISWWHRVLSLSYLPRVDYELWVPRGTAVRTQCVTGDIRIEERYNNVWVKTTTGNIELRDIRADIRADAVTGDIYMERTNGTIIASCTTGNIKILKARGSVSSIRITTGTIWTELEEIDTTASGMSFSVTTGDIDLFLPQDVGAQIDAQVATGRIDTEFKIAVQSTAGKGELRGIIGQGGLCIELRVVTGGISLRRF